MHVYYSDIISSCSNNLTRAFIQPPSVQQKKNQADCLSRTRDMTSVSFSDRVSRSRELLYVVSPLIVSDKRHLRILRFNMHPFQRLLHLVICTHAKCFSQCTYIFLVPPLIR